MFIILPSQNTRLAGWRGISLKMTNDMKKLEENAKVFDTRLDLLLRLLATQPSALVSADATPQAVDHLELSIHMSKTISLETDPSGPPPLPNGLEQSWLIVDETQFETSVHEQSPQEDHNERSEEFVEKQDHPHPQDVILINEELVPSQRQDMSEIDEELVPSQRQDMSEIDEVSGLSQRQDVSEFDESRGQPGRQDVIEVPVESSQHVVPLELPRVDIVPLGSPNEKLLEEMARMGFVDIEVNRKILALTGNNLQLAISMILRDE